MNLRRYLSGPFAAETELREPKPKKKMKQIEAATNESFIFFFYLSPPLSASNLKTELPQVNQTHSQNPALIQTQISKSWDIGNELWGCEGVS